MTEAFSGSYPIESRGGEIERLHIQSAAMVPDTERMLELIGVREGWSCLDIGCGQAVNHQPEFAAATVAPGGDKAILDGALGLAWTAIDAASNPALRARLES